MYFNKGCPYTIVESIGANNEAIIRKIEIIEKEYGGINISSCPDYCMLIFRSEALCHC